MDNRINEIRRKISALRSEMTDVEAAIRDLVNHDQDCTETSCRLMGMRAQVAALVGEWKAAGGGERLPTFPARLIRTAGSSPIGKSDRPRVHRRNR